MSERETLPGGIQIGSDPATGTNLDEATGLIQVLLEGTDLIPAKAPEGMCNVLTLALGVVLAQPGFETAKDYDWNIPIRRAVDLVRQTHAEWEANQPGTKKQ